MNKKTVILFSAFLLFTLAALSANVHTEAIHIESRLNKRFYVYCEFKDRKGNEHPTMRGRWEQDFYGVKTSFFSTMESGVKERFKRDADFLLVDYRPSLYADSSEFLTYAANPFKFKLREIFTVLTITDEDGVELLTLDTMDKVKIEYVDRAGWFALIIDEYLYE